MSYLETIAENVYIDRGDHISILGLNLINFKEMKQNVD